MVMHARKIPRLNDGCYERNQPHPFEDKYPSKSQGSGYGERYADKPMYESTAGNGSGMSRMHEASPVRPSSTRYNTGKPSYMDRSKERLDKGPTTSPGDRRGNHTGSMYGGRGDGSSGGGSGGDRHAQHGKDHRTEIQKSAIRVCGDWSEHLSSSGKKYYYNCTTEVSQWEKPKEWLDMYAREKNSRERHQNKFDERHRHSSGGGGSANHRVPASTSSTSSSSRHSSSSADQRTNTTYPNYSAATEHRQSPYAARSSYEGGSSGGAASDNHRGSASSNTPKQWTNSNRDIYRNKEGSTVPSLSRSHTDPYRAERYGRRDDTWSNARAVQAFNGNRSMSMDHTPRHDAEDSRQAAEDMDISPGSTPPNSGHNSHPNSRTGTPSSSTPGGGASNSSYPLTTSASKAANVLGAAVGALPRTSMQQPHPSHQQPHHQSPRVDNNDLTQQAIQTLQKLQEALVAQQRKQQQQQQQQQQQLHQQQHHQHHLQQQHHQQQHLHPHHPHHHSAQPPIHVSSGATTTSTTTTPLHHLPVQHHHHQLHPHSQHPHPHQQVPPLQHQANPHHPAHLSHQPHHLQPNNAVNQSPARPSEVTSPNRDQLHGQLPGQSPQVNAADASSRSNKDDEPATGQESPHSDHSVHSNSRRTASPTPSQSSSQSANVGGSSLSAAANRTDSILLQPSLANYYKDELITHITSWQNEANERQTREACRFSEEAHCIGTMHCMQVSVELKKARSLVRIAEIQATVQEQRVLFLKNQIKELENMKSQNSFMPYQGT